MSKLIHCTMKQLLSLSVITLIALSGFTQTIQEIQGEQDESPFAGQTVTTTGIVTAVFGDGFFIQDGSSTWSAIYVFENADTPLIGDEVTVSATVDEFYGLTELVSVSDVTVNSSGNDLPAPIVVSTVEVNAEEYECVLVTVENAECTNSDLGFGEFELDDGSGPCRVDDLLFLFEAQETLLYTVTGPAYYSFGDFKIIPREADDVQIASPLFFVETPEEWDITTSGMTITWSTNDDANTVLERGLTPSYELFPITDENFVTDHSVDLSGLQPGTIYYLRASSNNADGNTPLFERVVCTESESTGDINVYFNHEVNTAVATTSEATYDANITATIISYIELAQVTLDITMYDTNGGDQAIFDAVNARFEAGVAVRFITDEEPDNVELDWLNPGISVLAGNFVGIMHDKFLIIDGNSVDDAWVMTGSMNWTEANLGWDYNNVICIQDVSLAQAYTLEFNEMWGAEFGDFNEQNNAFSEFKVDNTPHKFVISGKDVEMYFSPSDGTTGQIVDVLNQTEDDIAFCIMAFTQNSLGDALVAAQDAGVNVEGIIDYVEFNGSEFDFLLTNGIDVIDYQNEDGSQWPDGPVLHHKYAIGDYMESSTNPWVITGSHNWTASAESINDENTLIIYDHEIANWYYQEYTQRVIDNPNNVENIDGLQIAVYPNPTAGILQFVAPEKGQWQILDVRGNVVEQGTMALGQNELNLNELAAGAYLLRIAGDQSAGVAAFVKQ